jgi:L-lysine 6-transaminase
MVRCQRYLEIMDEEKLVENAATVGAHLLRELQTLAREFPAAITNPRGKGLMCAVDLPTSAMRDRLRDALFDEGAIILGCGTVGLRFRPPLDVTAAEIDEALALFRRALKTIA